VTIPLNESPSKSLIKEDSKSKEIPNTSNEDKKGNVKEES
jgi:hypothetical protein